MTGPSGPPDPRRPRTSPGSSEPGASVSGRVTGADAGARPGAVARPGADPGGQGGADPGGQGGADPGARLAPREEAQLEASVVRVGGRGPEPLIAGVLIVAAFLLGLVRPWDLLGPASPPPVAPIADGSSRAPASTAVPASGSTSSSVPDGASLAPPEPGTPAAITCGFPSQWRSSTIEDWTGRRARVWKAAQVVQASGPDDPAIPFEPIVAATVTAIGWCAPIDGPDRPPLSMSASLYRIDGGTAVSVPHVRLEPDAPDALGELWVPDATADGTTGPWPLGRYVIELRSASGAYVRYLGLELTDRVVRAAASPSPRPAGLPDGSPGASISPTP